MPPRELINLKMQIKDAKVFDQKVSFIFHAILAGPLLLYSIGYLRTLDQSVLPMIGESTLALKTGVSFFSGLFIFLGFYFYKKEIQIARNLGTLEEKLSRLFKGYLIKYAFIELASFISAAAFFLTHDHLYTAVYVGILFLMSLNRPLPEKHARDLLLKGEERDIVIKKKELP